MPARATKVAVDNHETRKQGRYVDSYKEDTPMTAAEFKPLSKVVLRTLAMRYDPPPRIMGHGTGNDSHFYTNLRALLRTHAPAGAKILRGYRLLTLPLDPERWGREPAWKAYFHAVVAVPDKTKDGEDKWVYHCASRPPEPLCVDKPFIFVPSSRANSELTDEMLLTGDWHAGVVIGGNRLFCETVVADCALRGSRRSMISTSPEGSVAKRIHPVRSLSFFKDWYARQERFESKEAVAEMMGFPIVRDEDNVDVCSESCDPEELVQSLLQGVRDNKEAVVDGTATLMLTHEVVARQMNGEIDLEEARHIFYAHYDAQYAQIERVLNARTTNIMVSKGFAAAPT